MKIDNYAVDMNAQYFNLGFSSTQSEVVSDTLNASSKESANIDKVVLDKRNTEDAYNELSVTLSKSILKNINNESREVSNNHIKVSHTYGEAQAVNFQTKAFIQTKDKEIELSLDVSLSRSFVQTMDIDFAEIKKRAVKDPLVLQLDGAMPTLSSKTFSFDIDSDGSSDQISQLDSRSVFLALDKNKNGTIDNGGELFGTKSGDGFKDLSKFDDDKNGWIDENDAIFDKLRVWQKSDSKDKLLALGEVGIGAIFLGNAATPFELKTDSNALLGEIKKSGFFLYENLKAGVVSQIDLVVEPKTKESIEELDKLNKSLSTAVMLNAYQKGNTNTDSTGSTNSTDKRIADLKKELGSLEKELARARKDEKPKIETKISSVNSQMMSILSEMKI
jgi:hypothetical protein